MIGSYCVPEKNENQYASPGITGLFFDHKHSVYKDECSYCLKDRIQIEANHAMNKNADHATDNSSIVDMRVDSLVSLVDFFWR